MLLYRSLMVISKLKRYSIEKPILLAETLRERYQVMDIGWSNNRRVYDCDLHLDIINGKIWVQQNMTEMQIGQALMDKGVAKEDIVLGFQAPYAREYSGFAIG
jgi:XisI protein